MNPVSVTVGVSPDAGAEVIVAAPVALVSLGAGVGVEVVGVMIPGRGPGLADCGTW
jgi:hypothetical protein